MQLGTYRRAATQNLRSVPLLRVSDLKRQRSPLRPRMAPASGRCAVPLRSPGSLIEPPLWAAPLYEWPLASVRGGSLSHEKKFTWIRRLVGARDLTGYVQTKSEAPSLSEPLVSPRTRGSNMWIITDSPILRPWLRTPNSTSAGIPASNTRTGASRAPYLNALVTRLLSDWCRRCGSQAPRTSPVTSKKHLSVRVTGP
jgi:hypothetical protein